MPEARRPRRPPRPTAGAAASAAAVLLLALSGTVLATTPAGGQEPTDTGLTVYMQNLALVRAQLDRPVQAGERTVRVDGLAGNLDLSSLLVLEPGVTLLGVHGQRSYQSAGGNRAVSLALDLEVDRPVDGLRLAYLTRGAGWSASYSMVVAGDDRSAGVDGYATLSNDTGTTFEDASVQLLAGTVDVDGGGAERYVAMEASRFADAAEEAPDLSRQAFSGYHVYDVDVPLTLHAGDRRRLRLMGADSVSVEREYVLQGQVNHYQRLDEPQREEALIRYRVERPEGTSFGELPLPSGAMRVYQRDDEGRLQLLGADAVPNTPAAEELSVTVGRSFDIGGTRTQTAWERPAGDRFESAWEVALFNRTDERVVVQVVDRIRGDWTVLRSSHEAKRPSAHLLRFDVPVPADGEATLEYRIRVVE